MEDVKLRRLDMSWHHCFVGKLYCLYFCSYFCSYIKQSVYVPTSCNTFYHDHTNQIHSLYGFSHTLYSIFSHLSLMSVGLFFALETYSKMLNDIICSTHENETAVILSNQNIKINKIHLIQSHQVGVDLLFKACHATRVPL